MQLKKGYKKGNNTQQDEEVQDERQEMNELIDSDPELYGGDIEDMHYQTKKTRQQVLRDKFKAEMMNK